MGSFSACMIIITNTHSEIQFVQYITLNNNALCHITEQRYTILRDITTAAYLSDFYTMAAENTSDWLEGFLLKMYTEKTQTVPVNILTIILNLHTKIEGNHYQQYFCFVPCYQLTLTGQTDLTMG